MLIICVLIYILQCIFILGLNYYSLKKDSTLWDFIIFKSFEKEVRFPASLLITPLVGTLFCTLLFIFVLICILNKYFLKKLKFNLKNKLQTIKIK